VYASPILKLASIFQTLSTEANQNTGTKITANKRATGATRGGITGEELQKTITVTDETTQSFLN
jgi:hypothetical protein